VADDLDPQAMGARRFVGKIAIVTGGGQGIGRATARRLAQEGAAVVVADLVEETARRTCEELLHHGERAIQFVGDLRKREDCQRLVQLALQEYGRIDCLANIAGGNVWKLDFHLMTPEQIEATVTKNLWPTMWLTWSVLPTMLEQRSGSIVNIATHAVVSTGRVPYAAAKGGVIALTTSLSKEVAADGIRVNCVAPAASQSDDKVTPPNYGVSVQESLTPPPTARWSESHEDTQSRQRATIPMLRGGKVSEQASAIAFLLSEDASFITGQILPVGGGATFPF
jgi:dihydroxycyclohexadiene carboxylate dehydrogenase